MVIPYAAVPAWYAEWLRTRLDGMEESEALETARLTTGINSKALRRTAIRGASANQWLSVPVAKGPGMLISDHGNWPHVHLGALNAVYGRAPYFPFLFSQIEQLYGDIPLTVPELNLRMHEIIVSWLDMDAARMARADIAMNTPRGISLRKIKEELKPNIDPRLSILDVIFRFGKETLLILLQ